MSEQFVLVSCDKFFTTVGQLNVHPRSERDASYWETPSRELLGITTPGYMCNGECTYKVNSRLLQSREATHG